MTCLGLETTARQVAEPRKNNEPSRSASLFYTSPPITSRSRADVTGVPGCHSFAQADVGAARGMTIEAGVFREVAPKNRDAARGAHGVGLRVQQTKGENL